jgi:hypothetical protein
MISFTKKTLLHKIGSFVLYLPSIVLHYTSCPKATQNSKLINDECRPFHEDCKTKFNTYKQQTTKEKKTHTHNMKIEAPSKLHDANYPLFWHFLPIQIHATLHLLGHSIIQMFSSPLSTLKNVDTSFGHREFTNPPTSIGPLVGKKIKTKR